MRDTGITVRSITDTFKETIIELQEEPEFQWSIEKRKYAAEENEKPTCARCVTICAAINQKRTEERKTVLVLGELIVFE